MLEHFKSWLAQPYRADMSALDWFWFFGLVIIISAAWALIFRHIQKGIT